MSWTPLHHAAACGAVDAAAALCRRSKKAHPRARIVDDVDATDRDGFTPLHLAVVGGHLDVVQLLLGPGSRASTTQRSGPGGYNALHWAARAGDPRVLAEVRDASGAEATAERTRPPLAGGGSFGGAAALALNRRVGSDSSVVPSQTPIHVAASNGRVRALRLMLRHAANPRAAMEARDGAGRTPLAAAAAAGKHETVSAVARELGLEADDGDGDGVGGETTTTTTTRTTPRTTVRAAVRAAVRTAVRTAVSRSIAPPRCIPSPRSSGRRTTRVRRRSGRWRGAGGTRGGTISARPGWLRLAGRRVRCSGCCRGGGSSAGWLELYTTLPVYLTY